MDALLALTVANALDQLRRASTHLVAAVGVLLILSLRYFSAFGLGYEIVQLKEMAVYTIGLLAVVAVLLFALPRDDEPAEGAETQLLTRPVNPALVALGAWLGRLACLCALFAVWTLSVYTALWWFKLADYRLFNYRGATSALTEGHAVIVPVLGQAMTAAILLAFSQPLSRTRRPVLIAAGLLCLYVIGFAAPALGEPWARILPDLGRHDLTQTLWGGADAGSSPWLFVHAACWCAAGLALDSALLRARIAT